MRAGPLYENRWKFSGGPVLSRASTTRAVSPIRVMNHCVHATTLAVSRWIARQASAEDSTTKAGSVEMWARSLSTPLAHKTTRR
jgi:hypothetical protein